MKNQRGAVMVIGVFMAIFLTAALYYVVGIGEAIEQREQMQDAADFTAFSAAALHARGMNTIALINMLMAALLATLVALKLVETALLVAMVAMLALSWWNPALGGLVPVVEQRRAEVRTIHDRLEKPVHQGLEALNLLARGVRASVPWTAQLRAAQVATASQPPARFGFVLPPGATLPTVQDDFERLCREAGRDVGLLPALAIPDGLQLDGVLRDAIGELTAGGASWFCGHSDASPPSTTVEYEVLLPEFATRRACNQQETNPQTYDATEHREVCRRALEEEARAQPDPLTGACQTDCGPNGAYLRRVRAAREACAPRHHDRYDFTWQKQRWSRAYVWLEGRWQPGEPELLSSTLMRDTRLPCGHDQALVDPGYRRERRGTKGDPVPVCSDERPPQGQGQHGEIRRVRYVTASELLGCKYKAERTFQLADDRQDDHFDASGSTPNRAKTPQTLRDDAILGEAPFQLRAVVVGELPRSAPEGVLGVAAFGRERPLSRVGLVPMRALGRVALAQAEFYYAVQDPENPARESWMWNMNWQARLRRFHLGDEADSDSAPADNDATDFDTFAVSAPDLDLTEACHSAAAAVGASSAVCDTLLDLVEPLPGEP